MTRRSPGVWELSALARYDYTYTRGRDGYKPEPEEMFKKHLKKAEKEKGVVFCTSIPTEKVDETLKKLGFVERKTFRNGNTYHNVTLWTLNIA